MFVILTQHLQFYVAGQQTRLEEHKCLVILRRVVLLCNFFFADSNISTSTRIRIQIEFARPHVSGYFLIRKFFFAWIVLNIHSKQLDSIL